MSLQKAIMKFSAGQDFRDTSCCWNSMINSYLFWPNLFMYSSLMPKCRYWLAACRLQGGIQYQRGPKFTQFWPPTPSSGQLMYILHTTCALCTWPSEKFLLTTYLRHLVHVVIECPLREGYYYFLYLVCFLASHPSQLFLSNFLFPRNPSSELCCGWTII